MMDSAANTLWNLAPDAMRSIRRLLPAGGVAIDNRPAWLNEYKSVAAAPDVRRIGPADAGVAVIRVDGPLVGDPQWWYEGRMALTHSAVAAAVLAAANDPTVAKIALELNCPGWNSGESDLTIDAITKAASMKPVVARAHGIALSGGMWMASLCSEVSAARESMIGSIGAMVVLYDDSARFKREGIEANVFAFPSVDKAAGVPGVPLTDAAKQNVQAIVDANGRRFIAAVAQGRRISEEAVLSLNAAILTAESAKSAGLIDVIETQEAWESRVSAAPRAGGRPAAPRTPSGPAARAKETPVDLSTLKIEDLRAQNPGLVKEIEDAATAAVRDQAAAAASSPATFAQLKAIHGDDTAAIVASQEAAHTAVQATAARDVAVAARLKSLSEENASLKAKLDKGSNGSGVDPVTNAARQAGSYQEAVRGIQAADNVSLPVAMHRAASKNPEAYRRWKSEGCPAIA